MQCQGCAATQPTREAALRPEAADAYPFLPARMWTAAARLAAIVAAYRGVASDVVDRFHRVLPMETSCFEGERAGIRPCEPPV